MRSREGKIAQVHYLGINADGVGQLPQLRCEAHQLSCNVQQRVCDREQPQHLHVADEEVVATGELVGPQVLLQILLELSSAESGTVCRTRNV